MSPEDIESIDALVREACEQHDRFMGEQRREAAPVEKSGPGDLVIYRDHVNGANGALTHDAPELSELMAAPVTGELLVETLDQLQIELDDAIAAQLRGVREELRGLREELAELRGFRDGLVGRDVPTAWFKLRGEYREGHVYGRLDIVSRDGAWWIARCDDPGPIGTDGWKEGPRARQGDKGDRGERGLRGSKGDRGRDAPKFVGWDVDRANYRAVAKMSDGSTMTVELRPLFEQFLSELEQRRGS